MDDRFILVGRPFGVAIWHRDPRRKNHPDPGRYGDTAGWAWPRLNQREVEYAEFLAGKDNDIDNLNTFFPGQDYFDRLAHIKQIFRLHKRETRRWWQHPRWQFWNWRLTAGRD
jgi:hypothetical protein